MKVSLHDVGVGPRIRKDLGSIDELARSMAALGQLQPVVITRDNRLVAGYRRIQAAKQLGWEFIEAVHFEKLPHDALLLRAEGEENTCHKPFLPSEAIAMGMAIEGAEREAARKRKAAGTNQHTEPGEKVSQGSKGKTRDKVGACIGLSGPIYERGKAVILAAQEEPEKYGHLIDRMDRCGVTTAYKGINPAFGRVQDIKKAEAMLAAPTDPDAADWKRRLESFIQQETSTIATYTALGVFQAIRDGVVIWPADKQDVLRAWQAIIDAVDCETTIRPDPLDEALS